MKKIMLTLLIPVVFAFSPSPVSEVTPPAKGKAVVYFTRTSSMGFLINFNFFDKDKFIGKFHGTGYIRYECEPGEHLFWARAENRDFITAELEADKIYFVEAEPHMGLATSRIELKPIDPKKDDKKVARIEKLINKKEPDTTTPEEIASEDQKKEQIANAVKDFEDNIKPKGKTEKLAKEMFYEKK
jgi:hypothetical protein